MIGVITSVCAMSTMAAPSFDHNRQYSHHVNHKPMPPKPGFKHNNFGSHYNQHDRRHMNKFDRRDHGFNGKFDRKAPPMPPRHR